MGSNETKSLDTGGGKEGDKQFKAASAVVVANAGVVVVAVADNVDGDKRNNGGAVAADGVDADGCGDDNDDDVGGTDADFLNVFAFFEEVVIVEETPETLWRVTRWV